MSKMRTLDLYVSTDPSHHRVFLQYLQHLYGTGRVQDGVRVTHLKAEDRGSGCSWCRTLTGINAET